MTTLSEAKEAIYLAFETAWTPTGVAFTFDNEEFDPPESVAWARLSVRHTASSQETLGKVGNRKFARLGSVFVQVFTPIDQGTAQADSLATTARETFEGVSLVGTTVRFQDVVVRETGPEGKWYQTLVEANFEYDEIR